MSGETRSRERRQGTAVDLFRWRAALLPHVEFISPPPGIQDSALCFITRATNAGA